MINFRINTECRATQNLRKTKATRDLAENLIAFTAAAILILSIAVVVGFLVALLTDKPDIAEVLAQFVERWREYIRPEPVERSVYLMVIACILPIVLISIGFARRWRKSPTYGEGFVIACSFVASALLIANFLGMDFLRYVLTGNLSGGTVSKAMIPVSLQVCLAIAITVALLIREILGTTKPIRWNKQLLSSKITHSWSINTILIAVVLLTVVAVRLRSADMIYGDMHFEAVFYSVSQVMGGKTLIADLPSQYGLYAELLRPILALTGLSVLSFTSLLVVLQCIGALALLWVCIRLIRLEWLKCLAVMSIFLFVGSTWIVLWNEPFMREYYQVWPLRFLFPALSLFVFVFVRHRGMKESGVVALAMLAGFGIIWNLDAGIPTLGALVAYTLLKTLFSPALRRQRNLIHLIVSIVIPLIIISLFALYLTIKSGGELQWIEWIKYQRIFFGTGFGMLPLPLKFHPWIGVCGIYLYGLVSAVFQIVRSRPSTISDTIMYLSVLGFGLFTYYQGRSHDVVLSFVIWPAILIAFLLADMTLRAIRVHKLQPLMAFSVSPILVFGLLMSFLLATNIPRLIHMTYSTATALTFSGETPRSNTVSFIRSKVRNPESIVILTPEQSILFAENGWASAIGGPGVIEMLLTKDQLRLIEGLVVCPVDHLFISRDKEGQVPDAYRSILSTYRVSDTSQYGLIYLEPKLSTNDRTKCRGA